MNARRRDDLKHPSLTNWTPAYAGEGNGHFCAMVIDALGN